MMFIRKKTKVIMNNPEIKIFDLEFKRELQHLIAEKNGYLSQVKKLTELSIKDISHEKEISLLKIKIDKKSAEIKTKRFPQINFSTVPSLLALTYDISQINRCTTTPSLISYEGYVDLFSERFTLCITRKDRKEVSSNIQDKYYKNLKRFFSNFLAESNYSIEIYIKNKKKCNYLVNVNYQRLLFTLKQQEQNPKESAAVPSSGFRPRCVII